MSIREAFDRRSECYDSERRILVPGFDEFYGAVLQCATFGIEPPETILDLGAGTGLLAAMLAAKYPRARLTLLDVAPGMLGKARERPELRNSIFQVADYVRDPLEGPYDLVVSALSVHHLDDAAKRHVFERAFAGLRPGGAFVNADQVLAPTESEENRYRMAWLADIRAAGATEAMIGAARQRMAYDKCAPLQDQLAWLSHAGFMDADCWYKRGRFAVFFGIKPA